MRGGSCISGEEGEVSGTIYSRRCRVVGVGRWYQCSNSSSYTLRFGLQFLVVNFGSVWFRTEREGALSREGEG